MQYSLPVYNINKLDKVFDEDIQLRINDQLFFEIFMMEIIRKTISYSSFKKKQETLLEQSLLKKQNKQYLECDLDESSLPIIED